MGYWEKLLEHAELRPLGLFQSLGVDVLPRWKAHELSEVKIFIYYFLYKNIYLALMKLRTFYLYSERDLEATHGPFPTSGRIWVIFKQGEAEFWPDIVFFRTPERWSVKLKNKF